MTCESLDGRSRDAELKSQDVLIRDTATVDYRVVCTVQTGRPALKRQALHVDVELPQCRQY